MQRDKEGKNAKKKYFNKSFVFLVAGTVIMIAASFATGIMFKVITGNMQNIEQEYTLDYDKHYAFIAEDSESEFCKEAFAAAYAQAREYNAYLEDLGAALGSEYSAEDLLRIAVNSKLDGIVYMGGAGERVVEYIDRAADEGIGVVVLQNDVEASKRHCYVGINYYELGQMYALQIEKLTEKTGMGDISIDVLVDEDMAEGTSNLIIMAIEDYLTEKNGEDKLPEIVLTKIDAEDIFSAEESIRNIFLVKEKLPDIMLCANSVYTRCAYQAVIDYNLVGEIQIVGFFVNDTILDAIDKEVIYSTISIDTQEMGRSSIKALQEYNSMGYTNSYLPVEMEIIDNSKAHQIINEKNNREQE
ncbi:MAG: substrate-binding domain-containing protein [Lachnospiraceae bacterium]|nr:substrate-binding domain-containing protein [Lachnospiraceae bacterium]